MKRPSFTPKNSFWNFKGFTLIELIIVIIIIAILTAAGVPFYVYRIERTRGERAIANIELIKDALRMYRVKYGGEPTYPITPLSNINTNLDLELVDSFFNYTISNITTYRRIQGVRNSGLYNTRWVRYNIDPTDGSPDEWYNANSASKWLWHP